MWKYVVGAGVGVLIVLGLVAFAFARMLRGPRGDPMPFDARIWADPHSAEWREDELTERQRMLDDVTGRVLPGRCRDHIVEDLGPPQGRPAPNQRALVWTLGPCRGLGVDHEHLSVFLDEAGCYERHQVWED